MNINWSRERWDALNATRILLELLEDGDADSSRLIQGYLDAKRQLAAAFQALAIDSIHDPADLGRFVVGLELAMTAMFPHIPVRFRTISGFGAAHRRLFQYLYDRLGDYVGIEELRLLTGDATHTERRLRELRDLGVGIEMTEGVGRRSCKLTLPLDLSSSGRDWIAHQIAADVQLSPDQRDQFLWELENPA